MKVLFYPKPPAPGQKIRILLDRMKIPHTNNINEEGVTHVVHYDYNNVNVVSKEVIDLKLPIINERCVNVKKDYLDQCFKKAFGYSSFVNPTTHRGTAVIKSTQQAIHNGKFIKCPIKPEEVDTRIRMSTSGVEHTVIYQKLIDTRIDIDKLMEHRVPVINGEIPIVINKVLGVGNTFHPYEEHHFSAHTKYPDEVFSQKEIKMIKKTSFYMGTDFAEYDVLRDNSTGLIYIVDCNNIPMGTVFKHLDNKESVIDIMSDCLYNMLCESLT